MSVFGVAKIKFRKYYAVYVCMCVSNIQLLQLQSGSRVINSTSGVRARMRTQYTEMDFMHFAISAPYTHVIIV